MDICRYGENTKIEIVFSYVFLLLSSLPFLPCNFQFSFSHRDPVIHRPFSAVNKINPTVCHQRKRSEIPTGGRIQHWQSHRSFIPTIMSAPGQRQQPPVCNDKITPLTYNSSWLYQQLLNYHRGPVCKVSTRKNLSSFVKNGTGKHFTPGH